jgi:hypothetical protein
MGHRAPLAHLGLEPRRPATEHWMQDLLPPAPSVLHMSAKYPTDPIYAPRRPHAYHEPQRRG